jgi:hypothetical protein
MVHFKKTFHYYQEMKKSVGLLPTLLLHSNLTYQKTLFLSSLSLSLSHSLITSFPFSHTPSLTLSHTSSLTHTHSLSLFLTYSLSPSHSLSLTLTHSLSLSPYLYFSPSMSYIPFLCACNKYIFIKNVHTAFLRI